MALPLIALLGLVFSNCVLAADVYRINALFYHLGELIAAPQIDVRSDETTTAISSEPGRSQYKFVVLVRPASEEDVSVSMQFSSGKINIQPNLLIKLDKETSATIDKVRLTMTVQKITPRQDTRVAIGD